MQFINFTWIRKRLYVQRMNWISISGVQSIYSDSKKQKHAAVSRVRYIHIYLYIYSHVYMRERGWGILNSRRLRDHGSRPIIQCGGNWLYSSPVIPAALSIFSSHSFYENPPALHFHLLPSSFASSSFTSALPHHRALRQLE